MSLGPARSAPAEALLPEMEKHFQGEQLHSWGQALIPCHSAGEPHGPPLPRKDGFSGTQGLWPQFGLLRLSKLGTEA